ncbi:MAG: hypothetical protein PHT59_05465 [Candidatus Omnitrophica bacterium]|nr:hypothetical protein [Candidatus Omnitrophota bacterium]
MKSYRLMVVFALFVAAAGCASVREGWRGFRGVSTKALVDAKSSSVAKKFNLDYAQCVEKTKGILGGIGAYIYEDDPGSGLIAIYVSQTDTTPVGMFFEKLDEKNTQIRFTSQSDYARDYIAGKVESGLQPK